MFKKAMNPATGMNATDLADLSRDLKTPEMSSLTGGCDLHVRAMAAAAVEPLPTPTPLQMQPEYCERVVSTEMQDIRRNNISEDDFVIIPL